MWMIVLWLASCAPAEPASDGGAGDAAVAIDAGRDAAIDATAIDATTAPATLSDHRDRLIATLGGDPCATWAALDPSQRAVLLTITHRLWTSRTPDGAPFLAHVTRIHQILGGGTSGETCGGSENNRLFVSVDDALHGWMVETWEDARIIDDGGGSTWLHTRDAAGPHDPFDASIETDVGLRCTLFFENGDSRPPTAQAHFFLEGSAVAVERGDGISLPIDPRMMEIDQDFDCIHDSNPLCDDHEARYREHHGDFECEWVPSACTPEGTGCYRDVR